MNPGALHSKICAFSHCCTHIKKLVDMDEWIYRPSLIIDRPTKVAHIAKNVYFSRFGLYIAVINVVP